MILKGSQRAGAAHLAAHLLNEQDNDHVTVHELRGFVARDLHGALREAEAISRGTRCQQYLFSLSLNPPIGAKVSEREFENAVDRAEERLGLFGQPRAIVFHEKDGRRHAHVVWSRIDAAHMRAVNMAHFKNKLKGLARELFLDHGWQLPDGLRPDGIGNPLNFTLEDWQRAKRGGIDPREIKQVFRDAWNRSDSRKVFAAALEEYGYFLAKGDRRGFVAVDLNGGVHAIARAAGVKTKDVRLKLGEPDDLPSVEETARTLKTRVTQQMRGFIAKVKAQHAAERVPLDARLAELRTIHRAQRTRLSERQAQRWDEETATRAARLRNGLAGLWDTLTGKAKAIKDRNQAEAFAGITRDRKQRDTLVLDQMRERRAFQMQIDTLRKRQAQDRRALARTVMATLRQQSRTRDAASREAAPPTTLGRKARGISLDL